MEVINDLTKISNPFRNAVVTVGNFDGVHLGHQALIRQAVTQARLLKGTSVVMTFEPHPVQVLNCDKQFPIITPYEQKIELIQETNTDVFVCIPFTLEFSVTPARTFVKRVLCDVIGMKVMIAGPDYSFGKNAEGNITLLKELSTTFGFEVIIPEWVELGSQRVSSTKIRKLISEGNVEEAGELLGRYYQIRGTVIHGKNRGRSLLGFPTTNLRLLNELCPKQGVYAVEVEYDAKTYNGVANIGNSPTFGDTEYGIEVHILDFQHEIYNQLIRVNFVRRLRNEKKFVNPEALALQIGQDVNMAREILSNSRGHKRSMSDD
ncbi:MAG: bifunctional riboflavin kinase/FAD synthetase [Deltaproteobacteria bacterium]|nr:bifunctional riboflavin kinase/FAD synthetase [Deltaproteobacteria bacterium]